MRATPILSLALSIGLGLAAIIGGRMYLLQPQAAEAAAPVARPAPTTRILVALTPLAEGDEVTAERVRFADWPQANLPEGALTSLNALATDAGTPVIALGTIVAGEPLLAAKVSAEAPRRTLAAIIEDGYRGVTIAVTDVTGVGGYVLPDDRVDVVLFADPTGSGNFIAEPVLFDVRVLGVGQVMNPHSEGAIPVRNVTLEATPDAAAALGVAAERGELALLLRGEGDPDAKVEPMQIGRPARRSGPRRPSRANIRMLNGAADETIETPLARTGAAQ